MKLSIVFIAPALFLTAEAGGRFPRSEYRNLHAGYNQTNVGALRNRYEQEAQPQQSSYGGQNVRRLDNSRYDFLNKPYEGTPSYRAPPSRYPPPQRQAPVEEYYDTDLSYVPNSYSVPGRNYENPDGSYNLYAPLTVTNTEESHRRRHAPYY
ncbi:hypothetical protein PSACC_00231 [Paramicrosporidium saccamoebae]|uniref:Uncharacterized protein n=1 Tax=Paramicrosporidium saccamoebae TaxID=1246581 RepID=A0A2H9TQC6_9FUNG|nr:hypothetical protein PSACC_00231 [Paramicrosporidium saccamoebae]